MGVTFCDSGPVVLWDNYFVPYPLSEKYVNMYKFECFTFTDVYSPFMCVKAT